MKKNRREQEEDLYEKVFQSKENTQFNQELDRFKSEVMKLKKVIKDKIEKKKKSKKGSSSKI